MSVTFISNVAEVKAALKGLIAGELNSLGEKAVGLTVSQLLSGYGEPVFESGALVSSIAFEVDADNLTVAVGSDLDYAVTVHEGTPHSPGRPFLRDALNQII